MRVGALPPSRTPFRDGSQANRKRLAAKEGNYENQPFPCRQPSKSTPTRVRLGIVKGAGPRPCAALSATAVLSPFAALCTACSQMERSRWPP